MHFRKPLQVSAEIAVIIAPHSMAASRSTLVAIAAVSVINAWNGGSAMALTPSTLAEAAGPPWQGSTVRDLHQEYRNIFRRGNRNAASHLWARFLLERSQTMEPERLELMFAGFCAVSGSPVHPHRVSEAPVLPMPVELRATLTRHPPHDDLRCPNAWVMQLFR